MSSPLSSASPTIVWFRRDLRLAGNPALAEAAACARPVIPVFLMDEEEAGDWTPGGAARWWLHHALLALGKALAMAGAPLLLRRGRAEGAILRLAAESGAGAVMWNRCHEPWRRRRDQRLELCLAARGLATRQFNAALLQEPEEIATHSGAPYRVFTPFWRALRQRPIAAPLPPPMRLSAASPLPASERLEDWNLLPREAAWSAGLGAAWNPGEPTAAERLEAFLTHRLEGYGERRDRPGLAATSRLSPHLAWGEIGPRQVWHAALSRLAAGAPSKDGERFLAELGWREFSYHLLHHWPEIAEQSWRASFRGFPWQSNGEVLARWQQGETGYPIIDAGLRELRETGWMHNRVRMLVASFLTKDLLLPWQEGARWFWERLVDADLANNSASWQWVAGCGADAAPFFRIFNPVVQGMRFDPRGDYLRTWLPELSRLPDTWIHRPWEAPAEVRRSAGVNLGKSYPERLVDHEARRRLALAAFGEIRGRA